MKQDAYDPTFLPEDVLRGFCDKTETPFFLYKADLLRSRAKQVLDAFSFCRFRPFFPMRAMPNPHLLHILKQMGYGIVCGSPAEQRMAKIFGYAADETVFLVHCCRELPYGAAHLILEEFGQLERLPARITGVIGLRYHPGEKLKAGPTATFGAKRSQFGAEEAELTQMADNLLVRGCEGIGLHCQIERNCDDAAYYPALAKQLFELAVRLQRKGIPVRYCDLGGGLGYQSFRSAERLDIAAIAAEIAVLYQEILVSAGLGDLELRCQIGRWIAAPAGILVTKVVSARMRDPQLIGLDASAEDLLQTEIYDSYYHAAILGRSDPENRSYTDLVGWSQERKDRLAVKRLLPLAEEGDLCVLFDTGAYGQAMTSAYGGNLGCAEYLLDGEIRQIRRPHTEEELLKTILPWRITDSTDNVVWL